MRLMYGNFISNQWAGLGFVGLPHVFAHLLMPARHMLIGQKPLEVPFSRALREFDISHVRNVVRVTRFMYWIGGDNK